MNARASLLITALIALLALTALRPGLVAGQTAAQAIYRAYLPQVTKPPVAVAPIIQSFTASPTAIQPGGSATLSWQVMNATSLTISPGVGAVTGGSVVVHPSATTTYTLVASR